VLPRLAPAFALPLALGLAACGADETSSPAPLVTGPLGASIARLASTPAVAVVNPDQGSVSLLDPTTLEPLAEIDVGGQPHALLELPDGEILVSNYRGGELVRVDPATARVAARRAVCAGPWGLAASPDGASVLVACEWEGTVLSVDPATFAFTVLARGLPRPRAVAAAANSVFVAGFTGGTVYRIAPDGTVTPTSLVPAEAPYRPALTVMTANLAVAILPAYGRLYVAHELVNHDGDTSVEKVAEDYGSVTDGNPKINPALTALVPGADAPVTSNDPPVLYAAYDGGPRVFNGPSALAAFCPDGGHPHTPGPRYVLVAHESTADVAVIDTTAMTPGARAVGSFSVGPGPAGIAVDEAAQIAWVDNALDGTVSRLDLSQPLSTAAPTYAAALTLVRPLAARYSTLALEGRRLFHDATNPHVTPSAVVACSTCHPGGGDDGLVWFIHTSAIPLKRRRAPHLADSHTGTAPFHWNGQYATIPDLVAATVTELMAGDDLLVDGDSVTAYIDEIVEPPLPPAGDAAAIARGLALFNAAPAGCIACHLGDDLTDDGFHAVLDPMSLHADDVFTTANTPALHGLFLRAPYFHDGRATSLRDLLTRPDAAKHGGASQLSAAQLDDLIAYLESL
jgi:DNA-binding beta-propeller fold protein YncE/mono/diheme cytochrome c family protein